jgi:site-specific DNA-cytosine methylase
MNFISLCSGGGGMDLGLEKAGFKCKGQVEIMEYALKVLSKHWRDVPKHTDILTLLRSDFLVKIYQTPIQKEKVSKAKEALSSLNVCGLSTSLTRLGYSLRMFPDYFLLMKEGTLRLSCKRFPKAGMGIRGEFWTVNTSESPNDAAECSLSDVLEENVHPKYYLSRKAVAGMIRRSKKWGRGGYVFLQKEAKDKTQRLKLLSLRELEDRIVLKSETKEQLNTTSLPQRLSKAKTPTRITEHTLWQEQSIITQKKTSRHLKIDKTILSPKSSEQPQEEMYPLYGKTLILRKLTPTEKERLQGFPKDWTLAEE